MDEYVKLFFILLMLIISAFILIKYESFGAILTAFAILVLVTFIITYLY